YPAPSPLLKAIVVKLQRAAVLTDGADGAFVEAVGQAGADFQGEVNLAAHLTGQALDDLFDDQPDFTVDPLGINLHPAVVAGERFLGRFRLNVWVFLRRAVPFAILTDWRSDRLRRGRLDHVVGVDQQAVVVKVDLAYTADDQAGVMAGRVLAGGV